MFIKKYFNGLTLLIISLGISFNFNQNPLAYAYYDLDTSIYQYIGKIITEGLMPYRDAFDIKGPVIYLWHALGYSIHPMIGQWLIEILLLFLSLYLGYKLVQNNVSFSIYALSTAILLSIQPQKDWIGNTESLTFPILIYIVYIFQKYLYSSTITKKNSLEIGIICSAILLMKPTHLATPAILVPYIIIQALKTKNYNNIITLLLYGALGFTALSIVLLLWLYYNQALTDFYNDYIVFNTLYITKFRYGGSSYNTALIYLKTKPMILSILSIIITLIRYKSFNKTEQTFIKALLIAFIFTFIMIVLPANPNPHYITGLLPTSLPLLAFAISTFKQTKYLKTILTVLLVCQTLLSYQDIYQTTRKKYLENMYLKNAAQYIKQNLKKNETFSSTIEDYCSLYLYAQRNSTTKYPFITYLMYLNSKELVSDFWHTNHKMIVTKPSLELSYLINIKNNSNLPINPQIRSKYLFNLDNYYVGYANPKVIVWVHK